MFKKDSSEYVPYFVALAIILAMSSLFMPFFLLPLLQDGLFHSPDYWFFASPTSGYFITGGLFLYAGAVAGVMAYVQYNVEGKKVQKTIGVLAALLPVLIVGYLTVHQYYYFNNQGIYTSDFLSVEETAHPWESVSEAVYHMYNDNGTMRVKSLELAYEDGSSLSFEYNHDISSNRVAIQRILQHYGVELERIRKTE
ncbi:hypothetical protein JNUCC1_01940 [Lentibacillus sp. JNUCC-1]|uniref:hypothetical protein n=1 Tax=Lentibacillus sp. JNUCC-1 TaxID=2654513 RepID=UPI0012E70027|nr:hypothetical protein [Lentibacillus sp. JNUCC-1]MUV38116.1 hypothetical protein [Lentibacillus sp. JNUCC-1]